MFIVTSATYGKFMDLNGILVYCVVGVYDTKEKAIEASIKGMKDITELKYEKFYRDTLYDRDRCCLYLDDKRNEVNFEFRKFTIEALITECKVNETLDTETTLSFAENLKS